MSREDGLGRDCGKFSTRSKTRTTRPDFSSDKFEVWLTEKGLGLMCSCCFREICRPTTDFLTMQGWGWGWGRARAGGGGAWN